MRRIYSEERKQQHEVARARAYGSVYKENPYESKAERNKREAELASNRSGRFANRGVRSDGRPNYEVLDTMTVEKSNKLRTSILTAHAAFKDICEECDMM